MEHINITDAVTEIIYNQFGVHLPNNILDYEASIFEDLGADSIDCLEIGFAIEDKFNIELSNDDVEEMTRGSVNDMIIFIDKLLE